MPGKSGAEEIQALMAGYRKDPPATLGGRKVVVVNDYDNSTSLDIPSGTRTTIDLPRSNVMQFITEGDYIVSARPSGTEPKIKYYVSVNAELRDASDHTRKGHELKELIGAIKNDLLRTDTRSN